MINRVLMPLDGSALAECAVAFASDIAQHYGAEIILLHVLAHAVSPPTPPPELEAYSQSNPIEPSTAGPDHEAGVDLLAHAKSRASQLGAPRVTTVLEEGDPARSIVEHARNERIDLIVIGRRGVGTLTRLLLGSVSGNVSCLAPCPCTTMP